MTCLKMFANCKVYKQKILHVLRFVSISMTFFYTCNYAGDCYIILKMIPINSVNFFYSYWINILNEYKSQTLFSWQDMDQTSGMFLLPQNVKSCWLIKYWKTPHLKCNVHVLSECSVTSHACNWFCSTML